MTPTELQLVAAYEGPVIQLKAISKLYFGLGYDEARRAAALNALPVPTFRLTDSHKAPVCVHASDLAKHIDTCAAGAAESWGRSQV